MAGRGLSSAMLAAFAGQSVEMCYLLRADFDSGTLRLTDYARPLTWDSGTWTAAGSLLAFDGLSETGELLVNRISVTLSGVDTSGAMAAVLADDFLDRRLRIWLAVIQSGAVVADPVMIFDGRMDEPAISESPDNGTSSVSITGTAVWGDFGRRPGRHTSDAEQQFYFSGDLGFEFVSELPKEIKWGRA
jgi:hypothetical protein